MATSTIKNPKNIALALTSESHTADYYTNSWLATAKAGIYRVIGGGSAVSSSIIYGASNYYGILEVICESNSGNNYGAIVFHDAQNIMYYRNFNRESNAITWRGDLVSLKSIKKTLVSITMPANTRLINKNFSAGEILAIYPVYNNDYYYSLMTDGGHLNYSVDTANNITILNSGTASSVERTYVVAVTYR